MKTNLSRIYGITGLAFFTMVSCKESEKTTIAEEKIPGIVLENMDTSVSPKEDFYNYVNGTWLKTNTIPDDESRWGGFGVLRKSTRQDVLDILNSSEELGTYKAGSDQQKALLLFKSELDTVARNEAGIKPIQPLLDKINGINSLKDLQTVYASTIGVSAPFAGIGANPDLSDSSMNTAWVFPGGLGLQRDYYLDQDEKTKEIRGKYVDHVARMLQYINYSEANARKAAERILELETQLAEPRLDKVASRDIRNFNNPTALADLQAMVPSMDWQKFMDDMGIDKKVDTLLVMQPKYMMAMDTFLKSTSIEDIKTLMTWRTLDNAAGFLTTQIEKANWEFYGKTLNGAQKMRPADERALGTVDGSLGEAVGQLYVQAKFPPEAKEKAEKMIANVITAFQNRIGMLDWMSEDTKKKAIEKLDKLTVKIGYPDEWEDYSEMQIKEENSFAENMLAAIEWGQKKNISEINEPVDKKAWGMAPQTVNAYFNPLNN